MKKLDISTQNNFYTGNYKSIQVIFSVIATVGLILFSINLHALAGDKSKASTPSRVTPTQVSKAAQVSDFTKLDVNGDGRLSRDEAAKDKVLKSGFDLVDTDISGALDSNEYSVYVITTAPN